MKRQGDTSTNSQSIQAKAPPSKVTVSQSKNQIQHDELELVTIEGKIYADNRISVKAQGVTANVTQGAHQLQSVTLNNNQSKGKQPQSKQEISLTTADIKVQTHQGGNIKIEEREDGTIVYTQQMWRWKNHELKFDYITIEEQQDDEYQPSFFEKCMGGCCCQAYSCNCLTKRNTKNSRDTELLNLTKPLRKARSLGFKAMIDEAIYVYENTPLKDCIRDTLTYVSGILIVVLLIPSIIAFVNKRDTLNLLGLIFAIFASFCGLIDVIYLCCKYRCSGYRNCFKWMLNCKQNVKQLWEDQKNSEKQDEQQKKDSETKDEQQKKDSETQDEQQKKDSETQDEKPTADPHKCCQDLCKCCPKTCTFSFDFIRILMAELWFYPILLVNIFEFIEEYVDNGDSADQVSVITWLKNSASFSYTIFRVYISRMIIFVHILLSISKLLKINWNKAFFQLTFSAYASCQMILQIFMIFAIGTRYHHEYKLCTTPMNSTVNLTATDFTYEDTISSCEYKISSNLWYMMYFAYILPVFSMVMFYFVHHYWTQKYILTFCKNITQIMIKPDMREALSMSFLKSEKKSKQIEKLAKECVKEKFKIDFSQFSKIGLEKKLLYPFTSPFHVILCILYTGHLLAFVFCFLIDLPYISKAWFVLTVFGVVFGILINLYAVTVTVVYLVVFISLLFLIILLLLVYLFSDSSNRQNRNHV